jgi:hypothetical protein
MISALAPDRPDQAWLFELNGEANSLKKKHSRATIAAEIAEAQPTTSQQ